MMIPTVRFDQLRQGLFSRARALLAVSALAALAVTTQSHAQPNLLTAGDFEGISNPLDGYARQTSAGVWGTESGSVTGAANGITPFGSQMFQINHSGGGTAAQTNQIVHGPFKAGSVATFSVKFNSWLTSSSVAPFPLQAAVSIGNGVLDGDPNTDNRSGPAVASPLLTLDTDKSTWQTATVTTTLTSDTDYLAVELFVKMNSGATGNPPLAYADDAVLTVVAPAAVYASGLTYVTGWDPIFPAGYVNPDSAESTPVPSVGYNDPRWLNPHTATVFPLNSHPWEYESWVPAAFKFSANWINAWSNLNSDGHGKTTGIPGWNVPNQSWTKYSTSVIGTGTYVLQFLADNASWIYLDGVLVGFQDYNWPSNGSGRYTIQLSGSGVHDLGFVIWDGGGLAGGKFRLETKASFLANNPGATLPPEPATVTLSNLTHTYDGTPKSATVTTSPGSLTYSVTYNGSTTPPTNAGSYPVVATVTSAGYFGSATGTLTIGKATATITLANLEQTYDGTTKSVTATTNPPGRTVSFSYNGPRINAGSYHVIATISDPNYSATAAEGDLVIDKATATVTVNGYTGTFDGAAHGATGSATGVGGVALAGLNLGANFTNVPGGTANWTFAGGTNYNDASGTAAIVISKATATVTVNGYTGIYDGVAHGATGSATGVGGVDLSAGLTLGATFTNVPGGTASWTFAGGTNYSDASGTAAIAISKATAVVVVTPYSVTYDGLPHSAASTSISGVHGETGATVGSVTVDSTHTDAGTYSSDSWSFTGAANYNSIPTITFTDKIAQASSSTTTVGAGPFTYDSTTHAGGSGTVTGAGVITGSATLTYSGDQVNAGSYSVTAHYAGDANHTASDGSAVAITINQAASTTTTVGAGPFTYDGTTHAGGSGTVTGAGVITGSATLTYSGDQVNAGSYSVTAHYAGDANHTASDGSAVAITIAKATATVAVTPYSVTYDGLSHTAAVTITGVHGETGATVGTVTLSSTHTSAGTYATDSWSFAGANYNPIASTTITDTIAKAPAVVVVTPYSVTYDGLSHTATVTSITGVNGETGATVGTVTLNSTHTNAGNYTTDSWSFAGANYNPIASTTITDTIAKAPAVVVVTPYSVTYDGLSHTATVTSITGVNGETGATVGGVTLNSTHTNAGIYNTDSWSFTGAANYNNIASTTITDTIAKATAKVVIAPYTVEYDGLAHSATVTSITGVNNETGATVGSVTLSTTHTAVGIYATDSWSFTGAANYSNISSTTITDTIKDTTPPKVTASLVPVRGGGDDESTQSFTVVFSATDLVGVKTLTATLNGVTVTNGQVVQLQTIKSGAQSVKRDDGKLQIKATSFLLTVTATDAATNAGTATAVPVFVKNGKDSEDNKGGSNSDDKSDSKSSDNKSDDKKGG